MASSSKRSASTKDEESKPTYYKRKSDGSKRTNTLQFQNIEIIEESSRKTDNSSQTPLKVSAHIQTGDPKPNRYSKGTDGTEIINDLLHFVFFIYKVIMCAVASLSIIYCPEKIAAPIYILLAALLGICTKLLSTANYYCEIHPKIPRAVCILRIIEFTFWTILGFLWVFRIYQSDYETEDGYCGKVEYAIILIFTILQFIYFLFVITMKFINSSINAW